MQTEKSVFDMKELGPESLRATLGQSVFGRNIVFREVTDSTNILTKDLAARGAPEGTLVVCNEQKRGKGRMGRVWISPAGENLLFSLLLRPKVDPRRVFVLTMLLALAAIDAVASVTRLQAVIKWPNDLYVGLKKLGGILTEFSLQGRALEDVVLGLGLNVNWSPSADEGMLYPATSLKAETGERISRGPLLVLILKRFEAFYQEMTTGDVEKFYTRWNRSSLILGKQVEIDTNKDKVVGRASRIDRDGSLIILREGGREERVVCGDVSVREI
jgi:BirA family biotin operon repressor/biotin-[acetyl-CoA-carboxylase] ligase